MIHRKRKVEVCMCGWIEAMTTTRNHSKFVCARSAFKCETKSISHSVKISLGQSSESQNVDDKREL